MRTYFFIITIFLFSLPLSAQTRMKRGGEGSSESTTVDFRDTGNAQNDSSAFYNTKKKKRIKSHIKSWKLTDEYLGFTDSVAVDTMITNFQDNDPVNNYSIANSYNGNLGSPLQSKIYFNRTNKTDYLFSKAYDIYTVTPKDVSFFNTKTPYTLLSYRTGGKSYQEEDYLKALFSFNVHKELNIGLFTNFIYARGNYANQAGKIFSGGGFLSYSGKQYVAQGALLFNRFNNYENGGITDKRFITSPNEVSSTQIEPLNIPTNLTNAYNNYRNDIYYYNHKYRIGREKEIAVSEDSVGYEFIPIMSFGHTFKFEHSRRRYFENNVINTEFYKNNFFSDQSTNDSSSYLSLKNLLSVTLEEKFNKVMKFGLTAFVQHEWQRHEMFIDTVPNRAYDNNLKIGGAIYKEEGAIIKYKVSGDVTLAGDRIGDFNVFGDIRTSFRIVKDTMKISAYTLLNNEKPTYFIRDYFSNHYKWRNDFGREFKTRFGGKVEIPYKYVGFHAGVDFENITKYIYFDKNAIPTQYDGNIQVLGANVGLDFHAWRFHLENKAVYQISSNKDVLPLPDISLFSNFYYKDLFFKVLTFQAGVSIRYHTAYYAPTYMPATGQFYNQDQELIGNYPFLNAYLNFHLKKIRFFVQVHNVIYDLIGTKNYFSMPNYPLMPRSFRFGLSWTFYD